MSALLAYALALPIDGVCLDQPILGLAAAGAGVHAERATDRAGDAVVEREAGQPLLQRECREPLVGQRGPGAYAVDGFARRLAEAFVRTGEW